MPLIQPGINTNSGGTVTSIGIATSNGVSGSGPITSSGNIIVALGDITPTTVNGNTITTGTGTLTLAAGKVLALSNSVTLAGTDNSTLNIGAGGTLGSNAFNSTSFVGTASPTFTGTVGLPIVTQTGKTTNYNNIATTGWGILSVYGTGRSAAQTSSVATVATYTLGAADGSFLITSNVNVTTSTAHSFTVTCAYTDETNTARTLTLSFIQIGGGTPIATITNVTGAGPYEGVPNHIRCKASTSITIATTGTFTTVTYNVEGSIIQIA